MLKLHIGLDLEIQTDTLHIKMDMDEKQRYLAREYSHLLISGDNPATVKKFLALVFAEDSP